MKKTLSTLTALALALTIGTAAHAGYGMRGMHGGCGNCDMAGQGGNAEAPTPNDQLRKFQLDTIDMRQEMMIKRFELQRENLKATPDAARISALQTEIKAIQTAINDIRVKSGLPETGRRNGECAPMGGKGGCSKWQSEGCSGPCGGKP